MRIVVLGGMGFLGRNLVNRLVETGKHEITVFDRTIPQRDTDCPSNVSYAQGSFRSGYDFEELVSGADLVIHLVSTSVPGNEKGTLDEIYGNVIPSVELFDACAAQHVGRVVFMSSGGTVYGSSSRPNKDPVAPTSNIRSFVSRTHMVQGRIHMAHLVSSLSSFIRH